MLSKTYLRNIVKRNKALFDSTNNNNYIVEATIAYAIYNASGGVKLIPLPPFTDNLYNIVYNLAVVKIKVGNEISMETIKKAESHLTSTINNIRALELIETSKTQRLKLYTIKGVYLIEINNDIAMTLSKIAAICIIETCDIRIQTILIQDLIYKYFADIGRN